MAARRWPHDAHTSILGHLEYASIRLLEELTPGIRADQHAFPPCSFLFDAEDG